jgi:hypothetical protein
MIQASTIPIPHRDAYVPGKTSKKRAPFYRADFLAYLAKREGRNCLYCLKPLKPAQERFCSRACALAHDQAGDIGEPIAVPIPRGLLADIFRAKAMRGIDLASELRLCLMTGLDYELAHLLSYQRERKGPQREKSKHGEPLAPPRRPGGLSVDIPGGEREGAPQGQGLPRNEDEEPPEDWLELMDSREVDELAF